MKVQKSIARRSFCCSAGKKIRLTSFIFSIFLILLENHSIYPPFLIGSGEKSWPGDVYRLRIRPLSSYHLNQLIFTPNEISRDNSINLFKTLRLNK